MQRLILDTDVASLSIKGRLPPSMLRALVGAETGITFVTVGELLRWATIRQWGANRWAELEAWLAVHPTLPYDDEVARTWGEISAHATRRGRPRPQNDTWIAACCLVYELPLATLNTKDFQDFAEYEGLVLLGPDDCRQIEGTRPAAPGRMRVRVVQPGQRQPRRAAGGWPSPRHSEGRRRFRREA